MNNKLNIVLHYVILHFGTVVLSINSCEFLFSYSEALYNGGDKKLVDYDTTTDKFYLASRS